MVELGIAQGGRSKGAPPVQQWGVWFPPYRTYMSAAQGCAFTSQHGRVFDLLGIAHVGVTAQRCAFTSQHGRVCDLLQSRACRSYRTGVCVRTGNQII